MILCTKHLAVEWKAIIFGPLIFPFNSTLPLFLFDRTFCVEEVVIPTIIPAIPGSVASCAATRPSIIVVPNIPNFWYQKRLCRQFNNKNLPDAFCSSSNHPLLNNVDDLRIRWE